MLLIKGIIIGIGKIIPGLSGSMLAISMGIYQKMIYAINNFFSDIKSNFKFLINIFLGISISIIFFSNIILYLLNQFYIITMFLFVGLILGSSIDIVKKVKDINKKIILASTIIPFLISFININKDNSIQNIFFKFFYYIFVGFVDAITMVVPGISGTATLMMIGAYNELINTFSSILILSKLKQNILILFPFAIGLSLGIILSVKLISYLFKNFKIATYNAIIGFSISAIMFMLIKCIKTNYSFIELIISFVMLIIGFFISKKINQYITND